MSKIILNRKLIKDELDKISPVMEVIKKYSTVAELVNEELVKSNMQKISSIKVHQAIIRKSISDSYLSLLIIEKSKQVIDEIYTTISKYKKVSS